MSWVTTLPPGVKLVDKSDQQPSQKYKKVFSHDPAGTADSSALQERARRHMRSLASDFSCGRAIQITVGCTVAYEPADLIKRMNAWLAKQS